jgi:hypothetical protein
MGSRRVPIYHIERGKKIRQDDEEVLVIVVLYGVDYSHVAAVLAMFYTVESIVILTRQSLSSNMEHPYSFYTADASKSKFYCSLPRSSWQ